MTLSSSATWVRTSLLGPTNWRHEAGGTWWGLLPALLYVDNSNLSRSVLYSTVTCHRPTLSKTGVMHDRAGQQGALHCCRHHTPNRFLLKGGPLLQGQLPVGLSLKHVYYGNKHVF
jgi:hypothetical protein